MLRQMMPTLSLLSLLPISNAAVAGTIPVPLADTWGGTPSAVLNDQASVQRTDPSLKKIGEMSREFQACFDEAWAKAPSESGVAVAFFSGSLYYKYVRHYPDRTADSLAGAVANQLGGIGEKKEAENTWSQLPEVHWSDGTTRVRVIDWKGSGSALAHESVRTVDDGRYREGLCDTSNPLRDGAVLFDTDSAAIGAEQIRTLAPVCKALADNHDTVAIEGHANLGEANPDALAIARAKAVANYLIDHCGVSEGQIVDVRHRGASRAQEKGASPQHQTVFIMQGG